MTLGAHVRELRHERNLTIEQLAARADVAVATINRLERDMHEPTVSVLRRVAIALGVPASDLLTYEVTP